MNSPLMPSAMTMFCQTTTRVLAAMENISGRREGESSRMTASATSIAASEPRPPIATPTPDMASDRGVVDAVTYKKYGLPGAERFQLGGLAFGSSPARYSSRCNSLATMAALSGRSPVSMTSLSIPWRRRDSMAGADSAATRPILQWPRDRHCRRRHKRRCPDRRRARAR